MLRRGLERERTAPQVAISDRKGIWIGPVAEPTLEHFRRRVILRSCPRMGFESRGRLRRQTEVRQLDLFPEEQEVGGLDIAMLQAYIPAVDDVLSTIKESER